MTTFNDIFKSNFTESFTAISPFDMIAGLGLAFILGMFIFYIYKKTYAGVMYSKTFGVTLVALTMISAMVILAVTSNVVLSLGMVGALSIVRFRTAIKEPSDIAFLFWAIAVGIIVSAGFYPLAIIGSLFIGIILYVFTLSDSYDTPYILMVQAASKEAENRAIEIVKESTKKYSLKSKSVTSACIELTIEVRLKDEDTDFISQIYNIEDVNQAIMVSYNGEYMA